MIIHEEIYDLSFDELDRTMVRLIKRSDIQIGQSKRSQYCFYLGENVYGFLESLFRRIDFISTNRRWFYVDQSGAYSYMEIPIRKISGVNLYANVISLEKIAQTSHLIYYSIEKVIFNDPATIVFWSDGSKTIVKATDEPFDKEKGLAMAISKKHFGNTGRYFEEFKKWINEDKDGERK